MPKGYMGKLLWVDLTSGKASTTVLDEPTAQGYLAGSGLGAKLIHDRLKTIKGPLEPSSLLCLMPATTAWSSRGRPRSGSTSGSRTTTWKSARRRSSGGRASSRRTGGCWMKRAAAYGGKEKQLFKRIFELGTAGSVVATEAVGDMPIRNFLGGRWAEKAERRPSRRGS